MGNNMAERVFISWTVFGSAEMAHQYNTTTITKNFFDGWDSCPDSGIICNFKACIQGNIKVDPNECFLPGKGMLTKLTHRKLLAIKKEKRAEPAFMIIWK